MPSAISPEQSPLPRWKRPAPTNVDLPWAEISVIDISTFDEPGAKEKLANQLRHAVL
jgi:gibberellin 2-oxidase